MAAAKVSELAADADGLMACMADTVDRKFLAGCPRLRVKQALAGQRPDHAVNQPR